MMMNALMQNWGTCILINDVRYVMNIKQQLYCSFGRGKRVREIGSLIFL